MVSVSPEEAVYTISIVEREIRVKEVMAHNVHRMQVRYLGCAPPIQ